MAADQQHGPSQRATVARVRAAGRGDQWREGAHNWPYSAGTFRLSQGVVEKLLSHNQPVRTCLQMASSGY